MRLAEENPVKQQTKIIDGDGHIFEDGDGIARHFPYSGACARLEERGVSSQ